MRISFGNRLFETMWSVWPKISGTRGRTPPTILRVGKLENFPLIWYKNIGRTFVRFVTIHACDGQTDRQTDGSTIIKQICPSVCLSVRLSVTRVYCDKTNESSADILIPYQRKIRRGSPLATELK